MASFTKTITNTPDGTPIVLSTEMKSLAGKLLENYYISLQPESGAGTVLIRIKTTDDGTLVNHPTQSAPDPTAKDIVHLSASTGEAYRDGDVTFDSTGGTNVLRITLRRRPF